MYYISMTVDNTLRVLQRVCSVLSRNRINIEHLTVFSTKTEGVSRIDIHIDIDSQAATKLVKQLGKIIELHDVCVQVGAQVSTRAFVNQPKKERKLCQQ